MWNGFAGSPHQIYHLLNYRNHYSFIEESLKLSLKYMFYCFKWGLNTFFFPYDKFPRMNFLSYTTGPCPTNNSIDQTGQYFPFLHSQECFLQVPQGKPCCQFPADAGTDTHPGGERGGETRERLIPFDHQPWKNWMHLCKQYFPPPFPFKTLKHLQWETKG